MDLELRPVTDAEFPEFIRSEHIAFLQQPQPDDVEFLRDWLELDRTIGVFEQGRIVANAGALSFELTVPGGATVPTAGVTIVGVLPTHRRRGILTAMMQHQLADVAGRGEAIAVLTASEGAIYSRFGYGVGTFDVTIRIATNGLTFAHPPRVGGTLRMLTTAEAATVLPDVYDAARRARAGAVTRSPATWRNLFADRASQRHRASALFVVVHESDTGDADGFVTYRTRSDMGASPPEHVVQVVDLVATDPAVEATLWRFLTEIDLVTEVRARHRPIDDPLRWRLADPRRVRTTHVGDHLWVRILDPAVALAARRYAVDDALVIELTDPFLPANDGCWLVEGSPDGVAVTRTDRAPDLACAAPDLGSVYLGGVAPSTLARAGRVHELTRGALARADRFFVTQPAPWCSTEF